MPFLVPTGKYRTFPSLKMLLFVVGNHYRNLQVVKVQNTFEWDARPQLGHLQHNPEPKEHPKWGSVGKIVRTRGPQSLLTMTKTTDMKSQQYDCLNKT